MTNTKNVVVEIPAKRAAFNSGTCSAKKLIILYARTAVAGDIYELFEILFGAKLGCFTVDKQPLEEL